MKRQKVILSAAVLALIAGTAFLLGVVPQKLGPPGVKASPVAGSARWDVFLPEHILGFDSTNHEVEAGVWNMLPKDTSISERIYYQRGIIPFMSSVVLMGTDRTSIHKAEYCLQGIGMHIDRESQEKVRVNQPQPYDLPVIKIVGTDRLSVNGEVVTKKLVYVYWYVADGTISNDRSGFGRMWSMAKQLVLTGVLQRWAYVRFYAVCDPGQEDAAYEEITKMIADSVPQFQLTHGPFRQGAFGTTVTAQR